MKKDLGLIAPKYAKRINREKEGQKAARLLEKIRNDNFNLAEATIHHKWLEALQEFSFSPQQKSPPLFSDCDQDQEETVHLHINSTTTMLRLFLDEMQARSDFTEIFNNMSGILDKSKLSALAKELRKIYVDQEDLQIHIIGRQAIFIGKHFGKIIDTLHTENETKKQELIRHVLYLLFHLLRDMSVIWSKYEYTDADKEMENLKKYGNMIYNLFSLFFDSQWITSVIWALGKEVAVDAEEVYEEIGLALGVTSGQHGDRNFSAIKRALRKTNRRPDDKFRQLLHRLDIEMFYVPKIFDMNNKRKKGKNIHRDGQIAGSCICGFLLDLKKQCKYCDSTIMKNIRISAEGGKLVKCLKPLVDKKIQERNTEPKTCNINTGVTSAINRNKK
jgi:hypothetical protein